MDGDDWAGSDFLELNAYRIDKSDTMIHSEVRALYNYWENLRAGRKTPLRSDIDPRDMACDARNLFILENLGQGNIRFRLAGTSIVDAFGMEMRGMNARAMMAAASRESFMALIAESLEDPGVGYARLRNAADEDEVWEVLLLPLRSDFGMIDRVIGCLHPLTRPISREALPLRFRIEHMNVEPITATAPDAAAARPVMGFSAPTETFKHSDVDDIPGAFTLRSIKGGKDAATTTSPPQRGHLRLVDD